MLNVNSTCRALIEGHLTWYGHQTHKIERLVVSASATLNLCFSPSSSLSRTLIFFALLSLCVLPLLLIYSFGATFPLSRGCLYSLVPVFQRGLSHSGPWLGARLQNQQPLGSSSLSLWSCSLSGLESPGGLPAPPTGTDSHPAVCRLCDAMPTLWDYV